MLWFEQYKLYLLSFLCSFTIHYGLIMNMGGDRLSEPSIEFAQGRSVLRLNMMSSVDSVSAVSRSVDKKIVTDKKAVDEVGMAQGPTQELDSKMKITEENIVEINPSEKKQQDNDAETARCTTDSSQQSSEQKEQIKQISQVDTDSSVMNDADMRTKGVICESRVVSAPMPKYPRSSRRKGEEGIVSIKVWIDEKGSPEKVLVIKSSGFPNLDRAAVDALKTVSFVPATENNKPVASTLIQNIEFRLDR